MTLIRKVTVREDKGGNLFVKFKVYSDTHLIIRPNAPECFGGQKNLFKKGDKVAVSYWNEAAGFFMVKAAGKPGTHEVWSGPRWDRNVNYGSWVGEQIKSV